MFPVIGVRKAAREQPKTTERALPPSPTLSALDDGTLSGFPADDLPQAAMAVARSVLPTASPPPARPSVVASPAPVQRREPPVVASDDDEISRALWAIYNDTGNPADFVRADRSMRAAGGETAQGRKRRTVENIGKSNIGEEWQQALRAYRNHPARPGEAQLRPYNPSLRDAVGSVIAGDDPRSPAGELRRRAALAAVGSTGLEGSGYDLGLLDLVPRAGAALQVGDVGKAMGDQEYGTAAVMSALPAAIAGRRQIAEALRAAAPYARRVAAPAAAAAVTATPTDADASWLGRAARLTMPQAIARMQAQADSQLRKVPNENLWKNYGFAPDAAGDWLGEVSDKNAYLKPFGLKRFQEGNTIPLGQLLEHPALYRAYPSSFSTPVEPLMPGTRARSVPDRVVPPNQLGWYEPTQDILATNRTMSPEKILNNLLHEVEHRHQAIDGRSFGTGPEAFPDNMMERMNSATNFMQLRDAVDVWRHVNDPSMKMLDAADRFKRETGRDLAPGWMKHYAGFDKLTDAELNRLVINAAKQHGDLMRQPSAFEQYYHTVGEYNARQPEFRRHMTEDQRREIYPWSGQSTDPDIKMKLIPSEPSPVRLENRPNPDWEEYARGAGYAYASGGLVEGEDAPRTYEEGQRMLRERSQRAYESSLPALRAEQDAILNSAAYQEQQAANHFASSFTPTRLASMSGKPVQMSPEIERAMDYARELTNNERRAELKQAAAQTWPAQMVHDVYGALRAPGDALYGKLDPNSDEAIKRAFDLAGITMSGTLAQRAPAGAVLGSGPVRQAPAYQRELNPLGLYSHGLETAMTLPQAKGTPQQYQAMLAKAGVKPDELGDLSAAFAGKPNITRDDVAEYFRTRMPKLEETRLGAREPVSIEEARRRLATGENIFALDKYGELGREFEPGSTIANSWQDSNLGYTFHAGRYDDHIGEGKLRPKYDDYALPGGENYREVLLRLNQENPIDLERDKLLEIANAWPPAEGREQAIARLQELSTVSEIDKRTGRSHLYRSSHWDDPNVLAHIRMADRTVPPQVMGDEEFAQVSQQIFGRPIPFSNAGSGFIAKAKEQLPKEQFDRLHARWLNRFAGDTQFGEPPRGQRILNVEELQSDWAQEGRKKGFQDTSRNWEKDYKEFRDKMVADWVEQKAQKGMETNPELYGDIERAREAARAVARVNGAERIAQDMGVKTEYWNLFDNMQKQKVGVPSAPYVGNTASWTDLALKRVLREAANGNYDRIAFTPGKLQADRFGLDGRFDKLQFFPENNELLAYNGSTARTISNVTEQNLADHVGKELADKMLRRGMHDDGSFIISGNDLRVEAPGMRKYYDEIVPSQLKKLLKRLDPDAKIDTVNVNHRKGESVSGAAVMEELPETQNMSREERQVYWSNLPQSRRSELMKEYREKQEPFLSVQMTPKLREAIMKGLPAYASGGIVKRALGKLMPEGSGYKPVENKPAVVNLPEFGRVEARPIPEIERAAGDYMRSVGRPGEHEIKRFVPLNEDFAKAVAVAFDEMKHDPTNPVVRRAYNALADETLAQYRAAREAGIDFRFLKEGQADPYARSPSLGYEDLVNRGRLYVFPTEQGFGSLSMIADNPLLKRAGRIGDKNDALINDAFRVVHDLYGHFGPGNPFFRAPGEERAYQLHSRMYSPEARPAMASETRGQNSWVNFGPHAEHNRTASGADTVYADQKIGRLPDWAMELPPEKAGGGAVKRAMEIISRKSEKPVLSEVPALFDYSELRRVPDVPQFDIPRYDPPRGVPARVNDVISNKKTRNKMLEIISEGEKLGGANWYNAEPLRRMFVEEHGKDRGEQAFRKYMDFVAATSPRSEVGANARNASYYFTRWMKGEAMPEVGERNPQPYGHMAQRLHQMNANRVAGPGWDPINNPKPASFVENLSGNQMPVTVDTHAFRLPAIISKDPRFLETAYESSKGAPKMNIQKLVEAGEIPMRDAVSKPAFWQSLPKDNEYGAVERYFKGLGRELGLTPAQAQASAWVGGGKLTGLASDETKPFLGFLEDRVYRTAQETGRDPEDVLRQFIRGEEPLKATGGAVRR
jgi:hypothetical protein